MASSTTVLSQYCTDVKLALLLHTILCRKRAVRKEGDGEKKEKDFKLRSEDVRQCTVDVFNSIPVEANCFYH